jgi:uncharacterized protein
MASALDQYRTVLKRELPLLAQRFHVESLSVFGSYVRGEQRPESDLDLLVTYDVTPSLLGLIELENHLSDLLQVKVDLVMGNSLKPHIGEQIRRELMPV